jgi:tRNA dimethylallyltransferase
VEKSAALPGGIAIAGPTASGKSALAMRIAQLLPAEIISVDSAQVYRGMDIGTAKPTAAERGLVPHHLIDIRDPEQVYSAGEFRTDALRIIGEVRSRGSLPLLVGGTMLYFRALFRGIAEMPAANAQLRASIDERAGKEGWPQLHAELARKDPEAAARIHPNDSQRIQRALEVLAVSGRSLDEHWQLQSQLSAFGDWTFCSLETDNRALLHERIAQRLDAMLAAGFADEVSHLWARGTLSEQSPAMRLVGYRQLLSYVRSGESLSESSARALYATRQLAKRQMTWLRSGKIFPTRARQLKVDPFDVPTMERLPLALIKAMASP